MGRKRTIWFYHLLLGLVNMHLVGSFYAAYALSVTLKVMFAMYYVNIM